MLQSPEPSAILGDPVPCLTLRQAIRFAFGVRVGPCWPIGSSAESSAAESLAVHSFPLVTTTLGLFRLFRGNSISVRQIKQQNEDENEDENVCALNSCPAALVSAACTAKLQTAIAKALLNDL